MDAASSALIKPAILLRSLHLPGTGRRTVARSAVVEGAWCRAPTPLRQTFGLPPPHEWGGLVNRAADLVRAQGRDHALDLPPVAEPRDIAVVAALLRARRGLEAGIIAEAFDEI